MYECYRYEDDDECLAQLDQQDNRKQFLALCATFPEAIMYTKHHLSYSPFNHALQSGKLDDEECCTLINCLPANEEVLQGAWFDGVNSRRAWVKCLSEHKHLKCLWTPIFIGTGGDLVDEALFGAICRHMASESSSLEILTSKDDTRGVRRSDTALLPLFDLLGTNLNIMSFKVYANLSIECKNEYQDRMIDILKRNSTLTRVVIGCDDTYLVDSCYGSVRQKQCIIYYYTAMNRFGRGVMQDTNKSIGDLIPRLVELWDAETDEEVFDIQGTGGADRPLFTILGAGWVVPVLYGILREAPEKWSSAALALPRDEGARANSDRPQLKRKASRSLDREHDAA